MNFPLHLTNRVLVVSVMAATILGSCARLSPEPPGPLQVEVVYPRSGEAIVMGGLLTVLARVTDESGRTAEDARMSLEVIDPNGHVRVTLTAMLGDGDTYRFGPWAVPHRSQVGEWRLELRATAARGEGQTQAWLSVEPSTSEVLLAKYGFWLDAPDLRGIAPDLYGERGDAHNGMILWGGYKPAAHVLPANWVEIQWREGDFGLNTPEAVRQFLATEIGEMGFTPVRQIGAFHPVRFKGWPAWRADCLGQFMQDKVRLVVFRAPEVNETFAIMTTVVLPPGGIDPHAELLRSFEVHPEVAAVGIAPAPLRQLFPAPALVSPKLGAHYSGLATPIVLTWLPTGNLGPDDYYQVAIDFNHGEGNTLVKYSTRQTSFTLPEPLYREPNCHVFNWQVTLMHKIGTRPDGQPIGEALSYDSLYWYVWWDYPPGQPPPFNAACPNAQF